MHACGCSVSLRATNSLVSERLADQNSMLRSIRLATTTALLLFPSRHRVNPNILPERHNAIFAHPPFHRNAVDGLAHDWSQGRWPLGADGAIIVGHAAIIHPMPSDVGLW
jgi:hypothetical protein